MLHHLENIIKIEEETGGGKDGDFPTPCLYKEQDQVGLFEVQYHLDAMALHLKWLTGLPPDLNCPYLV